jgi:hypothetical protein
MLRVFQYYVCQEAVEMMARCSFLKYYAVEENNFLQQVITRYKILIDHFTPTSRRSTNEWKHPSKPTNTTYWQSAGHHLCDLSGMLLVDFLGHICTFNTDMYCARLKSLWEVLTILAMVQCSSSYPSGMDNLSHAVTSARTIKATTLKNSIPVTPSLCITSFIYENLTFYLQILGTFLMIHLHIQHKMTW